MPGLQTNASDAWSWVSRTLDPWMQGLQDWLVTHIPDFIVAIIILLIGYRLSSTAVRYMGRPVYQWVKRPSIARTVLRSIRYLIIGFSLLIALRVAFNLSLTSFVLTATVFSAVLGIILAPLVGDIINGLFVLGDQPYEIGDMIQLEDTGQMGFVDDVTIRYTKIFTLDNTFLVIPNSEIRKRDVVNYSAEDIRTRQTIDVVVTYESDAGKARELMREAASETPEVISTKGSIRIGNAEYLMAPRDFLMEFGDHGVHLRLRYWIRDPYHIPSVKSKVNEKIWNKFQEHEVDIAYPHTHHVFDETSGVGRFDVDVEGGG